MARARKRSLEEADQPEAAGQGGEEAPADGAGAALPVERVEERAAALLAEDAGAAEKRWAGLEDDALAGEVETYRGAIRALETALRVAGVDFAAAGTESKGARHPPQRALWRAPEPAAQPWRQQGADSQP